MSLEIVYVSSLEKVRRPDLYKNLVLDGEPPREPSAHPMLLRGEVFSFQHVLHSDHHAEVHVQVLPPWNEFVKVYAVQDAPVDLPVYTDQGDDDYLLREPGLMPDILQPLEAQHHFLRLNHSAALWFRLQVPRDLKAGHYPLTIRYLESPLDGAAAATYDSTLMLRVLDAELPPQKLLFTQWLHLDCIASAHHVNVFSEAHWFLIDRYVAMAAELGVNLLLVPFITPPVDTHVGLARTNVQLVDIERHPAPDGEGRYRYSFGFERLERYIGIARAHGISHFEMAPLFSQWGLAASPNVWAVENGSLQRIFGWDVAAADPLYTEFLEQMLPALVSELQSLGIAGQSYFHLSDEPQPEHLEAYRRACDVVRPLLGGLPLIDAVSHPEFDREDLPITPIVALDKLQAFREGRTEGLWTYYCCSQGQQVSNRFMAMPSTRNRILGLQLYKYRLAGFLHWGFNFYNSMLSLYAVNPFLCTSGDRGFPSGDPFSVYPGADGPLPSLRALVFQEGLQDMRLCELLETYIGYDGVVRILEEAAGGPLTLTEYPRNNDYLPQVNLALKRALQPYLRRRQTPGPEKILMND